MYIYYILMSLLYIILIVSFFGGIISSILGVILCQFLMEKIFSLIAVFIFLSIWLLLQGFEFLPLVILLLYVGSISILFLFVVIIINPDFFVKNKYFRKKEILNEIPILTSSLTFQLSTSLKADTQYFDVFFNKLKAPKASLTGFHLINKLFSNNNSKNIAEIGVASWSFIIIISFFIGLLFEQIFFTIIALCSRLAQPFYYELLYKFNLNLIHLINSEAFDTLLLSTSLITNSAQLDIMKISIILYISFGNELLVVGIILLVAIIGVIYLSLRKSYFIRRQSLLNQFSRYN